MMTGWTIYDHPRDFPDDFVARKWTAINGEVRAWPHAYFNDPDIDRVRAYVRRAIQITGFAPVCFERMPKDDPVIVEVWV